jgi:hypothetical protein
LERELIIKYNNNNNNINIGSFSNINCGGVLGSVLLFTHNSEHYDAFFNSQTFKTTVASNDQFEKLPEFIKV